MLEWLEKTNTRGKIMENIIIIGVIIILLVVGLRSTKKHFKGEGGCCGGGSKPIEVPEKKLDTVVATKTMIVDGMTCDHCKGWVEKAINGIEGASAKVNLKTREAVVFMNREISDEELRRAVVNAGYRVIEIK